MKIKSHYGAWEALSLALLAAACGQQAPPERATIRDVRTEQTAPHPSDPHLADATRFGYRPANPSDQTMTAPASTPQSAPLRWTVPQGWEEETAGPGSMRLATLRTQSATPAECSVIVLPGQAGGVGANFNRWRTQMGQGPLDAAALEALPMITVLGHDAPMIEIEGTYAGMGNQPAQEGYALLGVIAQLGEQMVFIKMTGPAAEVTAHRERFVQFCQSLEPR